ncbi:MAG: hypothetical protein ACTS73_09650 [Arsenophonus sp. NEOnobi-MAG3]
MLKISNKVVHINKGLLQRFIVIQQKAQHVVEGNAIFNGKGFLLNPSQRRVNTKFNSNKG